MLATPAGRLLDHVCAGCICLAPPPADTTCLPPSAGGIRRSRSTPPLQAPRPLQRSRARQMARNSLRDVAEGLAAERGDRPSRGFWYRTVSVHLPARAGTLGDAARQF